MKFPNWIRRAEQAFATRKAGLLIAGMGFLLGRAMILDELTPFAAAYFAVIYFMRREYAGWVATALITGSIFTPHAMTWVIVGQLLVFVLVQRGLQAFERSEISHAPLIVMISSFSVNMFRALIGQDFSWYGLMMSGVDAVFGFVLTLIFTQAVPVFLFLKKNYTLKNEEIVCLIILLASVMTGMAGWTIQSLSITHIVSRYLILLFALAGGAPLGASVGVVTGLILSLADMRAIFQMSLLAFSGMLAGMLREGRKWAVGFGMLLGSSILSIYLGSQSEVVVSTLESVVAIALFLLTPKALVQSIARYVPGTQEHAKTQHDYARRIRDVTAERVNQFSEVFRQLARSFRQIASSGEIVKREEEFDHFMNAVAERSCATCYRRNLCWDGRFYQTYQFMTDMMTQIEERPDFGKKHFPKEWNKLCAKPEQVLGVMKQQYELYKHDQQWKKQIQDSRHLVAEQLSGVSQVMEDLAKEIQREGQELTQQEERIRRTLDQLGLSIQSIDVVSLDPGHVEIEVMHTYTKGFDECRKIIAPLLSDIIGEHIVVSGEQYAPGGREGTAAVTFRSAKTYEIETGVAFAAKGGDLLSGDSFSTVELGNGKFAVAISDGMGNGERAQLESSTALTILEQLLQSGMDERLAIKSVNSVLMLRSADEVFATVDMALIDMHTAKTTFMKIGSTPSYIKRGREVIPITASNLPIGILQEIEVDLVSVQLQPGDTLIMMTDGIFDAPGYAVNKDLYMKRIIQEMASDDPQEIADCLLETVVRSSQGEIRDDMTVVVAKIEKHRPEWATIHWPGVDRLERPRTVS